MASPSIVDIMSDTAARVVALVPPLHPHGTAQRFTHDRAQAHDLDATETTEVDRRFVVFVSDAFSYDAPVGQNTEPVTLTRTLELVVQYVSAADRFALSQRIASDADALAYALSRTDHYPAACHRRLVTSMRQMELKAGGMLVMFDVDVTYTPDFSEVVS